MAARLAMASRKVSSLAKGMSLPSPSGQFAVGCVDLMQKLEGDSDGLLVRLFYPSSVNLREGTAGYQYAKWLPHKRYSETTLEFIRIMVPGLRPDARENFTNPHMPAFEGAPLLLYRHIKTPSNSSQPEPAGGEQGSATTKAEFPVIVFAHGMGGMRTVSSAICCDLASHGYVVAAVEHRDGSACSTLRRIPGPNGELVDKWEEFYIRPDTEKEFYLRNKQVKQRAFDAKQTLNMLSLLNDGKDVENMLETAHGFNFGQFKDALDVTKAAMMGHSFGGATAVQTLSEDSRFVCGIGLDSWLLPIDLDILDGHGIEQPLLFINSFDWQWKRNVQRMMKLVRPSSQCALITIKDTHHFNQTDMPFTIATLFDRRPNMVESRVSPLLAHQVNMDVCHDFLRRHLLNDSEYQHNVPSLDGGEGCSEFIIHGTNVDMSNGTSNSTSAKL